MLELKRIKKVFETGDFRQTALNNVSITFREKEFVSILGPSGSGKTTLLNIIGGLDNCTSGDLIIDGVSTREYRPRDWDSYRNHRIGFVFQSYNLIGHQSILKNVELALTLSGVSRKERTLRAKKALKDVGLGQHIKKRPSQLSGGQMQRVAIARALVNNPEILLADEPTGALDTQTSTQIMDLLKEVAEDRLVIMVTHNPDLAKKYSTRIVNLKDGKIAKDSSPYKPRRKPAVKAEGKKKQKRPKVPKTSMGFWTAFGLSLNNLMTKKGRTILTAVAGSIGIIGIALILSLSNGIHEYINKTEEETLSEYPVTLEKNSLDMSAFATVFTGESKHYEDGKIHSRNMMGDVLTAMSSSTANNLKEFKKYLEEGDGQKIKDYTTSVQYGWKVPMNIYKNSIEEVVQVNPSTALDAVGMTMNEGDKAFMNSDVFVSLIDDQDLMDRMYTMVKGRWPEKVNELVLCISSDNEISDYSLYSMGILPQNDLKKAVNKLIAKEDVSFPETTYTVDELMGLKFRLVLPTDYYKKQGNIWVDMSGDETYMKNLLKNAMELEVVGVIKPSEGSQGSNFPGYIGYSSDLQELVVKKVRDSEIAKAQLKDKTINVLTGKKFGAEDKLTADSLTPEQQAYLATLDAAELAKVVASYQENTTANYESNLLKLGIGDLDDPDTIQMYPKNFEAKKEIEQIIKDYNEGKSEEEQITYSDMVGTMISSVSAIVDVISSVLIAFVAVSLVVSSIMIAIITYISVLERTKEIGILRAIGASKKDVSRVFKAETLIEGLAAGAIGIGVTLLLTIPINAIVKMVVNVENIAVLPAMGAVILIALSVILTMIAGLMPAKMASKKDPVEALRSE